MLTNLAVELREGFAGPAEFVLTDNDTDNHDVLCVVDPDNIIENLVGRDAVWDFAQLLANAPALDRENTLLRAQMKQFEQHGPEVVRLRAYAALMETAVDQMRAARPSAEPGMKTYEVYYSYQDRDTAWNREKGSELVFQAKDGADAIESFARWFANRKETFSKGDFDFGYFHRLLAVKVCRFQPSPIDEKGHALPTTNGWFFEWKCDWGYDYNQALAEYRSKMEKFPAEKQP